MISKKAVRMFEDKERRSFAWMKHLKRGVVEDEVDDFLIAQGFRFKTKPYLHQLVCWYIGVCENSFLFLLDMGGGKTKITLDIFSYFKETRQYRSMLVLVPNLINMNEWADEVEIHTEYNVMMLDGTTEQRRDALSIVDHDVYVINYQGMLHLVCDRRKGSKMVINKNRLRRLASHFDMLVLDEIHNVKNHESLTFRACNAIRKQISSTFGLTGTPTGRNPEDFWSQFFLIDDGETLGETLEMFRSALFRKVPGWGGWMKWEFNKSKKRVLHKWIQNKSLRYSDYEMAELPRENRHIIKVNMDDEQKAYYKTFRDGLFEKVKEKASVKAQDNYYIRLRQISSGFLNWRDEDTGERTMHNFTVNAKMDAVDSIVTNIPYGHKIIIFIEFNPSGDKICEFLKSKEIKYSRAYGGKKGVIEEVQKFKTDPECIALVANTKAAGQGGNFQIANYALFYESPSSPIIRRQAERRMSGPRQKLFKHVHFYDLVASTVEEKIQVYLKEGKDLFQAIVDGREVDI